MPCLTAPSHFPPSSPDHDFARCEDTEAQEAVMGQTGCLTVASNTLKFTEEAKGPDPGLQTKLVHKRTNQLVASEKARKKATCSLNAKPSTVINTIFSHTKKQLWCTLGGQKKKKQLQWQHTLNIPKEFPSRGAGTTNSYLIPCNVTHTTVTMRERSPKEQRPPRNQR